MWRDKKDLIRQQGADTMAQLAEATQSKGAFHAPYCPRILTDLA